MSNSYPTSTPVTPEPTSPDLESGAVAGHSSGSGAGSGTGATERAAEVKDTSVAAGQHVADVTKDEIHRVSSETKRQAKDLYRQTQSELADQAATQQKRVASGLRTLGDELGSMAESSETQGVASDLAHQAATRAAGVAEWLDQRDPGSLLNEVKGFARRRPGTFIAVAAVAGVLAGRLTRSVVAESKDTTDSPASANSDTETGPLTPVAEPVDAGTPHPAEDYLESPAFAENRNE